MRAVAVAGVLLAVSAALSVGVVVGIASHGNDSAVVTEDSVDVGFSRDMREHHAHAVDMSVLVRDGTGDPQVRTLALDILLTQQQQAGQMYGWLAAWGQDQARPGPPMTWMPENGSGAGEDSDEGHGDMAEMGARSTSEERQDAAQMPGMATDQQLRELGQAQGRRAERLYLQLMIPHHQAGVAMAEYAAANASQPQVRRLAQSIVDSQTAEVDVLRSMLKARGGALRQGELHP